MVAFQHAVDLGYRYLETDLHLSGDGVLVCVHDPTLDRTTDGRGPISSLAVRDLQMLDAGFRFDPIHHFPFRASGIRIPTLEEVATSFPDAVLTVDLKQPRLEDALTALIARLGLLDRIIVGSFRDRRIRRFRRLTAGRVATSSGPMESLRFVLAARAGRARALKADVLQIPVSYERFRMVDAAVIQAAHRLDKQVHVWTVNDLDEMEELLDMEVDGLITDRPDLLRELMEVRGSGGPWH